MHAQESVRHAICNHYLTSHAHSRMEQRGISPAVIEAVLRYGRTIYARGLAIRVVGHKEVSRYAPEGIDLSPAEGIQVLVAADGSVVTAYRNHDLRKTRPGSRRKSICC